MSFLEGLMMAALRSAVLAMLLWCALRMLRINRAATRLAAWSALLLAALVMPVLPWFVPEIAAVARPEVRRSTSPEVSPLAASAVLSTSTRPLGLVPAPAAAAGARLDAWKKDGWNIALGLYGLIASAMLARVGLGLMRVSGILRQAREVPELGVDVRETSAITIPATAGLVHPQVLLPRDWRTWDANTLRAVLSHERAHAQQKDFAIQTLARVHRAMFWFSPLSWWLNRRLAELGEQASDDAALMGFADRAAYASVLLEFGSVRRSIAPELVAMARWTAITARIDRILDERFHPGAPLSTNRKAALAATLAVAACGLAGVTLKAQQAPTQIEPSRARQETKPSPLLSPPDAEPGGETSLTIHSPGSNNNAAWVIFLNGRTIMNGNENDRKRALGRRGDRAQMIWFRNGKEEYVIEDRAIIGRVKDLFQQTESVLQLEAITEELKSAQEARAHNLEKLGEVLEVHGAELSEPVLAAQEGLATLRNLRLSDQLTSRELAEIELQVADARARLDELQARIAALQAGADSRHQDLAAKNAEMAALAGVLANKLARNRALENEQFLRSDGELRQMLEEAVRNGAARRVDWQAR